MSRKVQVAIIIIILLVATAGAASGVYLYIRGKQTEEVRTIAEEVQQFQVELRKGLIRSCERNGNPLRIVVQGLIQEQIKTSSDPKIYREFFPQIPEPRLEKIIRATIEADRARLRQIAPLDCAKLYPNPNKKEE
jgi:hypothetical protein